MCTCMFLRKVIVVTLILHTPWVRLLEFIFWQLAGSAGIIRRWGQSGRQTVSHLRMSRRDLPSLCAQWKSHHRQSALQRTSHCSGLIFFWYRRWVLGWWPSSVAALGSCGLSVPPAARLKWRNVWAILFLQEFKQHDAIWQKNIPIAKTATFFRYLNFCHFFTQKGLALGMLLTFIKMQLHFFKSFQDQIFQSFQMKLILCLSVPPYKRKCV